jgi:hypothetical protein
MEGMLSSEAAVLNSHKAHIAVAASDNKSSEQSSRSADPRGGQEITASIGLLACCCIDGLCRRFLFVVFPAVFIMRRDFAVSGR